jgi:hypothetical protein
MDLDEIQPKDNFTVEQKPSIKIIRNTKGFNYEVKILELDVSKLKTITDELEKVYGIKSEDNKQ